MPERSFIGDRRGGGPPMMEDGKFYDLVPPSNIKGKIFHRVRCEYRVPNRPNEYVVEGIPEGETEPRSFVLCFTDRGLCVTPSGEQDFDHREGPVASKRPNLRIVH